MHVCVCSWTIGEMWAWLQHYFLLSVSVSWSREMCRCVFRYKTNGQSCWKQQHQQYQSCMLLSLLLLWLGWWWWWQWWDDDNGIDDDDVDDDDEKDDYDLDNKDDIFWQRQKIHTFYCKSKLSLYESICVSKIVRIENDGCGMGEFDVAHGCTLLSLLHLCMCVCDVCVCVCVCVCVRACVRERERHWHWHWHTVYCVGHWPIHNQNRNKGEQYSA